VIDNSKEVNILCTSDKFSVQAQVGYASFRDVNRVITDDRISEKSRVQLEETGIQVITAKMD
jgi:DeoR/GlpR family transcriptional regulator of sugar metabolism